MVIYEIFAERILIRNFTPHDRAYLFGKVVRIIHDAFV